MSLSRTFQWVSRFKAGRTSTDDDERSGRPVSSSTPEMIERVRQIIRVDRLRSIDVVSMLVTKPGFTPTTLKPKLNPVNGKFRGHLDRRRQGK